jgi:hypothetical protein
MSVTYWSKSGRGKIEHSSGVKRSGEGCERKEKHIINKSLLIIEQHTPASPYNPNHPACIEEKYRNTTQETSN